VPSQGNLLDWADKALGQGISSVTRSVKNLLSGARQAPVAAALEALLDGKQVRRAACPLRSHCRQMHSIKLQTCEARLAKHAAAPSKAWQRSSYVVCRNLSSCKPRVQCCHYVCVAVLRRMCSTGNVL
jgi:hypothetical protein